jgi:hypothetical protein
MNTGVHTSFTYSDALSVTSQLSMVNHCLQNLQTTTP